MAIIKVICGWCKKSFETNNQTGEDGEYPARVCSNCGRLVDASRKEQTENIVGRKHSHFPNRTGDVV